MSIWKFWKRAAAPVEAPVPAATTIKTPTAIEILARYVEYCYLVNMAAGMTNTYGLDPIVRAELTRHFEESGREYMAARRTLEFAMAERGEE